MTEVICIQSSLKGSTSKQTPRFRVQDHTYSQKRACMRLPHKNKLLNLKVTQFIEAFIRAWNNELLGTEKS